MLISYWENQPTDNPSTLNGFAGTWNFSDHRLVAGPLIDFITEVYDGQQTKFHRIPLEKVNEIMNDVWEGPGSMGKLARLYNQLRKDRFEIREDTEKKDSKWESKTIDQYSDEELKSRVSD